MIQETVSRRQNPAVTSDRWHVVHARWTGGDPARPRFDRSIVSEHDDRPAAVDAARALLGRFGSVMAERAPSTRDQIFVRQPGFKSLKTAKRRKRRRK